MPAPLVWTKSRDACLIQLRADGASWDAIALELGISRWAAVERGRRIGARPPPRRPPAAVVDLGREPLPAGHPISWGAIAGAARYPFPPLVASPVPASTVAASTVAGRPTRFAA